MRRAIIRQRAKVARAWARVEATDTPRRVRKRVRQWREQRRILAGLRITEWSTSRRYLDAGRCPRCHNLISLAEAEDYRDAV